MKTVSKETGKGKSTSPARYPPALPADTIAYYQWSFRRGSYSGNSVEGGYCSCDNCNCLGRKIEQVRVISTIIRDRRCVLAHNGSKNVQ